MDVTNESIPGLLYRYQNQIRSIKKALINDEWSELLDKRRIESEMVNYRTIRERQEVMKAPSDLAQQLQKTLIEQEESLLLASDPLLIDEEFTIVPDDVVDWDATLRDDAASGEDEEVDPNAEGAEADDESINGNDTDGEDIIAEEEAVLGRRVPADDQASEDGQLAEVHDNLGPDEGDEREAAGNEDAEDEGGEVGGDGGEDNEDNEGIFDNGRPALGRIALIRRAYIP